MTILNLMPRVAGSHGAAFAALFDEVIAPVVCPELSGAKPGERRTARRLEHAGEAIFMVPPIDLLVVGAAVGEVEQHLQRYEFASMCQIDLLTMDLTRVGGMIDCEVELCGSDRVVRHSIPHLALWLSASGEVALVSEAYEGVIDYWKPSILVTGNGLIISEINPYPDEAGRERGIIRAIEASHYARSKVELAKGPGVGSSI